MTSPDHPLTTVAFVGVVLDARYRLEGLIGRGGMASVYRGEDLSLHRPVAIKVFEATAEGIDDRERRSTEIELLASVSHHALVRLYDASHDPTTDREFLVMELIDGDDLRGVLRRGPLAAPDAKSMLADLAEALHVIHQNGIIHRDIKPANVLLAPAHLPTRKWNAKLADFGIARLVDDARITRTGMLVGTPGYVSPEQALGQTPVPASDIYALGLLILEARTQTVAFPGPAVAAAAARLSKDPEIPATLGADWVELLRAMTSRNPDDRPTALEVAVAAASLDAGAADAHEVTQATPASDVASDDAELTATPRDRSRTVPLPRTERTGKTRILAPATVGVSNTSDEPRIEPVARAGRPSHWKAVSTVGAVAAAVAIVAGVWLTSAAPSAGGEREPLPSVPGELGVHLEQLGEAVTR